MLTRCVYSSCGSVQREVYMQGFVHVKFSPLNVLRLQICGSIGTLTFRFITAEICLNTFLLLHHTEKGRKYQYFKHRP